MTVDEVSSPIGQTPQGTPVQKPRRPCSHGEQGRDPPPSPRSASSGPSSDFPPGCQRELRGPSGASRPLGSSQRYVSSARKRLPQSGVAIAGRLANHGRQEPTACGRPRPATMRFSIPADEE
jgi:hypothetical protein